MPSTKPDSETLQGKICSRITPLDSESHIGGRNLAPRANIPHPEHQFKTPSAISNPKANNGSSNKASDAGEFFARIL